MVIEVVGIVGMAISLFFILIFKEKVNDYNLKIVNFDKQVKYNLEVRIYSGINSTEYIRTYYINKYLKTVKENYQFLYLDSEKTLKTLINDDIKNTIIIYKQELIDNLFTNSYADPVKALISSLINKNNILIISVKRINLVRNEFLKCKTKLLTINKKE